MLCDTVGAPRHPLTMALPCGWGPDSADVPLPLPAGPTSPVCGFGAVVTLVQSPSISLSPDQMTSVAMGFRQGSVSLASCFF